MVSPAAKVLLLLLLLALPPFAIAQTPYSDASFQTFISISKTANNGITARVVFLNITYFSQIDEKAIAEIIKKVKESQDINDLYQRGSYSTDSFSAVLEPVDGASLYFTFEGQNISDGSNDICNPVKTDSQGTASCTITHYKDSISNEIRWLEEYKSCGYATIYAAEMNYRGANLASTSQTVVVCPENNSPITAFGPAIMGAISSRLPFCFPAMLIVGLLLAAMYYSGRDPLSLFDITTPRLPKTQTFKVKSQKESPQMLRQVQRRYMMIKKQARRDSVREIARLAKASGRDVGEAKRKMHEFYNELEKKMGKPLSEMNEFEIRRGLANLMMEYRRLDTGGNTVDVKRFDRSLALGTGLLNAYLASHQAWKSMGEARGKTSKGGLWTRNVSTPLFDNLTKASIAFEGSKVAMVLGRIPVVRGIVSAPTKMLDVSAQLRGSRSTLKAIRGEFLGEAATLMGRTVVGKPVYNAFRGAHVRGEGADATPTKFGKFYTWATGRSWKTFEDKHDLSKKKLVDYNDNVKGGRQWAIDVHNRMFDEIAGKLLFAMQIRANVVGDLAKKLKLDGIEGLVGPNALGKMPDKLVAKLKDLSDRKLAVEIAELINKNTAKFDDRKGKQLLLHLEWLERKAKDKDLKEFVQQLRKSMDGENKLNAILKKAESGQMTQSDLLAAMAELAKRGKGSADSSHYDELIREFKKSETELRASFLVYLDKNYYQAIDKSQLKSDIESGVDLKKKYGESVASWFENSDAFRRLVAVGASAKGAELKRSIEDLKNSALISQADRNALDAIAGVYGGSRNLTNAKMEDIKARLNGIAGVRELEGRVFAKFDSEYNNMRNGILEGKHFALLDSYARISDMMNRRLDSMKGVDIERMVNEGSTLGKNPYEMVMQRAMEDIIRKKLEENKALTPQQRDALWKTVLESIKGIRDMDTLEQFFREKSVTKGQPGAYSPEFKAVLAAMSTKGEVRPQDLERAILQHANDFARVWNSKNWAASDILHGGGNTGRYLVSFKNALKDIEESSQVKAHLAYLGGEKPFYRAELGQADRSVATESSVFTARGWEKVFGFVVSDKWGGTSRGEQVLHLMGAARESHESALARYKVLYNNLVNEKSILYDKKFAEGNGADFNIAAYDAIMKRGYTWQDKKNGLELLLSVDRKSTPMLEWEKRFYREGQGEIILRKEFNGGKADIRDYAPLVARTMGSMYSTREVGFVILTKQGDKWIYGDPYQAFTGSSQIDPKTGKIVKETVGELNSAADKQVSLRQQMMLDLVDKVKTGNYDPTQAGIRVISTKDFVTYAKDKNYQDFFGTGKFERLRERIRSSTYQPGMLAAEFVYGAYNDRLDKMQKWYVAQYQLRQALDRLQHTLADDGMVKGEKRFKYNADVVDDIYKLNPVKSSPKLREHREELQGEMENLAKGKEAGYVDSAKAWWYEWRGRIASSIIVELGSAETKYYNARLSLRALDSLAEKGTINATEYKAMRSELLDAKNEMRDEYKKAKNEYMGLNRDIIGWTGSHSQVYTPQRTIWNLGVAGKLLDGSFVQGTKDAFYQITESSVMRDPRVAIGAGGPGFDWSWYVGYHTGQNVYERARFWATNSMWEQQSRFMVDLSYTTHKWWNDKMSFFARYTAGYPSTVKSDMMYAPQYEHRKTSDYFKALLFVLPLQSSTYSDYFKARRQDAITFSGAGSMLAAYQSLGDTYNGENKSKRGAIRAWLDKYGAESQHYFATPFRISSQQRYVDQVMAFDNYVDKQGDKVLLTMKGEKNEITLNEARDRLKAAITAMDLEAEAMYSKAISDKLGKIANLKDKRGAYVRNVFSGSDIQEDGSRNRFLDMYTMFHSNVFSPTIPGMLQSSPIGKREWYTFPQVARQVEDAPEKTRLGAMKHYWEASYDKENNRVQFKDRFTTRQDSVAEAYRNDTPVLMHLMKMQYKEIAYSPLNTPSLSYINPIWFGFGRQLYKTALHHMPDGSPLSTLNSTVEGTHDALGLVPYGHRVKNIIEHGIKSPKSKYDTDYRRVIYQGAASAVAEEGTKSGDFFKWCRDGVYGWRWQAVPGSAKISKKAHEDYVGVLSSRK
jgi:hypothetical protein